MYGLRILSVRPSAQPSRGLTVPTGKVKWYDADKGFGFLSSDDGGDVHVRANALPAGVEALRAGTRVEFGIVEGRKGASALQVRVLDPAPSVVRAQREAARKSPEDMVVVVEDTIRLLDDIGGAYRAGRHPDAKHGKQIAIILRALADQLDA